MVRGIGIHESTKKWNDKQIMVFDKFFENCFDGIFHQINQGTKLITPITSVELKKQSSCSVRLANNTHHHVAFKVKTTSPKNYCVRPNVGVVLPQSACDFTVIKQAQRIPPPDMVCKDKFLIQSTIVPPGTTDDDITPGMFSKDSGKYIEENKLRVTLISPSASPVLSPVLSPVNRESKDRMFQSAEPDDEKRASKEDMFNGVSKLNHENGELEEELSNGASKLNAQNGISEDGLVYRTSKLEDQHRIGVDIFSSEDMVSEDYADSKVICAKDPNLSDTEEPGVVITEASKPAKVTELKQLEKDKFKTVTDGVELKFAGDVDDMKSRLRELELYFGKAQFSISRLTEEGKYSTQELKDLRMRLMEFSKLGQRKVHNGFPPLLVFMVALVCLVLGYLSHP